MHHKNRDNRSHSGRIRDHRSRIEKELEHHKREERTLMRKLWWFIWEDDSVLSWIVNIILAFILIKFIVYPGLGFALSTTHPIVAVVSGSMEHRIAASPADATGQLKLCGKKFNERDFINYDDYWNVCGSWYVKNANISKLEFRTFDFRNGFNTGDIMILRGKKPQDLKIGDVIVYQTARPDPIIHRVVDKWDENGKYFFQTKGDHNAGSNGDEYRISEQQIIGKAVFRIPLLGWVKIRFVQLVQLFR